MRFDFLLVPRDLRLFDVRCLKILKIILAWGVSELPEVSSSCFILIQVFKFSYGLGTGACSVDLSSEQLHDWWYC